MNETHAEDTERLLGPLVAHRNALAHLVLSTLLDGDHADAAALLPEYQLACFHVSAAADMCQAFDDANPIDPD